MKTIHAIFTDEEHKKIFGEKKKLGMNWHDLIMMLKVEEIIMIIKKRRQKFFKK